MCIIVYKKAGVELPTKRTLETCFKNNPDGAGFMFAERGTVTYKKGYMTFKSLYKALCKTKKDWTNTPLAIHFRIATHGGTNRAMCHPFAVTRDTEKLKAEHGRADVALMHNGILQLTADSKNPLSDSALFARDFLTRLCTRQTWYNDKSIVRIIDELRGTSRLAIMSGTGKTALFGKWYTVNGVDYSNETYKERKAEKKRDYYSYYAPCDYCYKSDCRDCRYFDEVLTKWDC